MNKLPAFVVCCLFLQLTAGASLPFSRSETTRAAWDGLLRKFGRIGQGRATTMSTQMAVPTVIRYSTTQIVNLAQDEQTWFVGKLCGQSVGKVVSVTMLLNNNNPGWEPTKGVVDYAVVDSHLQDGVLCTNKDSNGYATSSCLIEAWPNMHDIIIVAKAGPVSGIAMSVNAEFFEQGTPAALQVKLMPKMPRPDMLGIKGFNPMALPTHPIPLTETVSVFPAVSLGYLQEAMIQFSWCNNAETTVFKVESTITSADGESSYAQYICDTMPCDVGVNNIAHNGEQLTSNTIVTDPMLYKAMYVVIVNWGGVYDKGSGTYVGNFLYNANQVKLA